MSDLVAVTGAAGFQGRYVIEALSRAGIPAVAVVRAADRRPFLDSLPGVEVRLADLLEPNGLAVAFQGAGAVVHLAGHASPRIRGWDENRAANVDGTANVIDAMGKAGARRLIHFSTIGAYRVLPQHLLSGEALPESHPLLTERNLRLAGAYRVSKALSEALVMERAPQAGLHWTILRSSATFGRGDPNVMPTLAKLTQSPVVPLPRARFPLVHAGDVAAAPADGALPRPLKRWKKRLERLLPRRLPPVVARY